MTKSNQFSSYLTGKEKIEKCENNLVTLTFEDGRRLEKLEPRRLFPNSAPDEYITLLGEDGHEVGILRTLSDLEESSRQVIADSLSDYYVIPKILQVLDVSDKSGTLRWTVVTDRGEMTFDIRNRIHDIRAFDSGLVRIRDANDNRYIIQNVNDLDSASRRKVIAEL